MGFCSIFQNSQNFWHSLYRDRQMKVAARNEALQHATEELQKRIEQKVFIIATKI